MNKRGWGVTVVGIIFLCFVGGLIASTKYPHTIVVGGTGIATTTLPAQAAITVPEQPSLDIAAYNEKLLQIANLETIEHITTIRGTSSTPTSTIITTSTIPIGWPVRTTYPDAGPLLPFDRIVAYYGNLSSPEMGVLGEYPKAQVLQMLASTTQEWQAADPTTTVVPALDYIAVAAQGTPGVDSDYRLRMSANQIEQVIQMATQINGIIFLDVQVGLSSVEEEVPLLAPYLKLPQINLALDPEFDMHDGQKPGTAIGTMDASDINYAADYLANIVKENNLPPKILVVHLFTQSMVTNYKEITPLPEVQIVMDMDGFGSPAEKLKTFQECVEGQPVQFAGLKLFYKNDTLAGHLMTPAEVIRLSPEPSYIQYQ